CRTTRSRRSTAWWRPPEPRPRSCRSSMPRSTRACRRPTCKTDCRRSARSRKRIRRPSSPPSSRPSTPSGPSSRRLPRSSSIENPRRRPQRSAATHEPQGAPMAKITFAAGTSHTPMLLASDETLPRFEETDKNIKHRDKEGRPVTYGDLLEKADPKLADMVAPQNLVARQNVARAAAKRLRQALAAPTLDPLLA